MFRLRKNQATDKTNPQQAGILGKLRDKLARTRSGLMDGLASLLSGKKVIDENVLASLLSGKKVIDENVLEELETALLSADIGVEATQDIISDLTDRVSRKQLNDSEALFDALHKDMLDMIEPCSKPLVISGEHKPFVILMVGVNGVGKTTTIGKLAKKLQASGQSVMLAAGDTFRAAAVEQLQVWGERNQIAVVAQARASDPASVIFDAMQSAKARGIDVLIADTAGRLHTQANLMEELKKIRRVISRLDDSAPHEVMLVVDAGTGQNALSQARQFHEAVQLTGITLTKLDGTAKGGIIFAIAKKLSIPIRFIGVGEGIDDLREFNAGEFIDAIFGK